MKKIFLKIILIVMVIIGIGFCIYVKPPVISSSVQNVISWLVLGAYIIAVSFLVIHTRKSRISESET